ncbi:MAG: sugar phosphate isomerase/epimerase family protein [Acidobacteriota bacterium]
MKLVITLFVFSCLIVLVAFGAEPSWSDSKTGTGPGFKGPVGVQLYSFREDFKKDVPGTLKRVRDYGFEYVELAGTYGLPPTEFKKLLDSYGLKAVAGHFDYGRFQKDPDGLAQEAKTLGLEYAGMAWIPHEGDFDEQECRAAAAVFNKAGEALARQGIKFFYHQHGYEFQPHAQGTLLDLLMEETKPELVQFEMDTTWVVFPGQDPVKLLEKYKNRWTLMHLKDLKKGVKGNLSGGTDPNNDVVLGTGQIDMPAVLKAAQKAGVKYYFIEDESSRVAEQVPQSLRFLEQVRF